MNIVLTFQELYDKAEKSWGAVDGRNALPEAVQLTMRIEKGAAYCQQNPSDFRARRSLSQLRDSFAQLQQDPIDQARCKMWRAAYAAMLAAIPQPVASGDPVPERGEALPRQVYHREARAWGLPMGVWQEVARPEGMIGVGRFFERHDGALVEVA